MPIEIVLDPLSEYACMFDSDTMITFGPVFRGAEAVDQLNGYVAFVGEDLIDQLSSREHEVCLSIYRRLSAATAETVPAGVDSGPVESTDDFTASDDEPIPYMVVDASESLSAVDDVQSYDEHGPDPAEIERQAREQQTVDTLTARANFEFPFGHKACWNCAGTGEESGDNEGPCGICDGAGHLPA